MTKSSMCALSKAIAPAYAVVEARLARGHLEAHRARRARCGKRAHLVCRTRKAGAVVHPAAASGLGRLTLRLDRLGRTVAVVRPPLGHETIGHRAVAIEALGLEVRRVRSADVRPLIPVEAEPAQAVHDSRDHLPRRTLGVGVLDAQHERSAVPAGIQPVEKRRAGAADVQVAGGRRSEADADHVAEGIVPSEPTCRARGWRANRRSESAALLRSPLGVDVGC